MPRQHHVDWDETKKAGFSCPKSFRSTDGHDFLRGSDMSRRRTEVWDRSRGQCEGCRKPIDFDTFHTHHVIERGDGGSDDLANLKALCPGPEGCHAKMHAKRKPMWTVKTP